MCELLYLLSCIILSRVIHNVTCINPLLPLIDQQFSIRWIRQPPVLFPLSASLFETIMLFSFYFQSHHIPPTVASSNTLDYIPPLPASYNIYSLEDFFYLQKLCESQAFLLAPILLNMLISVSPISSLLFLPFPSFTYFLATYLHKLLKEDGSVFTFY